MKLFISGLHTADSRSERKMNGKELRTVIVLTTLLASIAVVYALTSASIRLDDVVFVKALGVGVYRDSGCSQTRMLQRFQRFITAK